MSYAFSQLSSIIVAVPPPRLWLTHSLLTSMRSGEGLEALQVPPQWALHTCWWVTHTALVTNLYQRAAMEKTGQKIGPILARHTMAVVTNEM